MMKRRDFLKAGTLGVAAGALAAPAVAQDDVREWKMVTAWPKNLPDRVLLPKCWLIALKCFQVAALK